MTRRRTQLHVRRSRQAYTLVEMMFALAIFGIIMLGIASLSIFTARSFEALGHYSDMDRESRHTLDTLSRDIRQTVGVFSCTTNQLVLTNLGSSLTFQWNPTNGLLTRVYQDATVTISRNLLRQCDYLSFGMCQRVPADDFVFRPTDNPAQAKLIEMTWRCSRQIYGKPLATESLQTAKFTVRN